MSKKLKTFAHAEFSKEEFSSPKIIKTKILKKIDLFNRGHQYKIVDVAEVSSDRTFRNAWEIDEAELTDGVGD